MKVLDSRLRGNDGKGASIFFFGTVGIIANVRAGSPRSREFRALRACRRGRRRSRDSLPAPARRRRPQGESFVIAQPFRDSLQRPSRCAVTGRRRAAKPGRRRRGGVPRPRPRTIRTPAWAAGRLARRCIACSPWTPRCISTGRVEGGREAVVVCRFKTGPGVHAPPPGGRDSARRRTTRGAVGGASKPSSRGPPGYVHRRLPAERRPSRNAFEFVHALKSGRAGPESNRPHGRRGARFILLSYRRARARSMFAGQARRQADRNRADRPARRIPW